MTTNINGVLILISNENEEASLFKLGDYRELAVYKFDIERRLEENKDLIKYTLDSLQLPHVELNYSLLLLDNMSPEDRYYFLHEAIHYSNSKKTFDLCQKYNKK